MPESPYADLLAISSMMVSVVVKSSKRTLWMVVAALLISKRRCASAFNTEKRPQKFATLVFDDCSAALMVAEASIRRDKPLYLSRRKWSKQELGRDGMESKRWPRVLEQDHATHLVHVQVLVLSV